METKISDLQNTNNKYFDTITKKDMDIENLKKENEKLKEQLMTTTKKLSKDLKKQHQRIK